MAAHRPTQWQCGERVIDLSTPKIMGILNVTPDSFADGGRYSDVAAALDHVAVMKSQGADIVDIGGESTRPDAEPISLQQELDRVMPVLEKVLAELDVVVSVDTQKTEVMQAAIAAGAHIINDVNALQASGAVECVANSKAGVCLMHRQGCAKTMQLDPQYQQDGVVADVQGFLQQMMTICKAAGIDKSRIALDPGFGFGKTLQHNLQLLRELSTFQALGCPLLVGLSRKSMFERIGGWPVKDRLPGSLAAAMMALERGAYILRVHDVAETHQAVSVFNAVYAAQ